MHCGIWSERVCSWRFTLKGPRFTIFKCKELQRTSQAAQRTALIQQDNKPSVTALFLRALHHVSADVGVMGVAARSLILPTLSGWL